MIRRNFGDDSLLGLKALRAVLRIWRGTTLYNTALVLEFQIEWVDSGLVFFSD